MDTMNDQQKILQYLHKNGFIDPIEEWQQQYNEMVDELTKKGKFEFNK